MMSCSFPSTSPGLARAAPDRAPHKVLSFALGPETYGIDIRQVQEVRSFEAPTPLPHTPGWLLGVTNLRGTVVPIVDLRVRLGLPAQFDRRTVTAVLDLGTRMTGIVVDGVSDVLELQADQLRALPQGATPERAGVLGLANVSEHHDARPLILLDPVALLGDPPTTAPLPC
nr:chemotaxis protein CheW [Variovorax boronicumulans]